MGRPQVPIARGSDKRRKGGFKAIVMASVEGSLTREVPLPPQRRLGDRYDSRGRSRPGQPGAGYERKADTLSK